jgi:osmotically-inducible protein OsmY
LQRHGEIDASDIEVSCEDGVLTLKGEVEDRQTKRAAEECVESIYGIGDVMNELRIKRNTDRDASKDDAKDREEAKSRS